MADTFDSYLESMTDPLDLVNSPCVPVEEINNNGSKNMINVYKHINSNKYSLVCL